MIQDIKHLGLFRVDVLRLVLDLPHKEIAQHCLNMVAEAGAYTIYGNPSLNKKFKRSFPHREQFENDLRNASDEFVKRSARKSFESGGGHRLDYWCSVYSEHDYHDSHIHQRSLISGTYYPLTSGDSASITLEAPWTNFTMHDTIDYRQVLFEYRPDPGDCLLWPSWLNHRVARQTQSSVPRIAISFNADYRHEPDSHSADTPTRQSKSRSSKDV